MLWPCEELTGLVGNAFEQFHRAGARRLGKHAQGIGDEAEPGALFFILRHQAQQQPLLKCTGQIQIAHLGIVCLAEPIDAAIALLQTVGIVWQFQMNEMLAAGLQI